VTTARDAKRVNRLPACFRDSRSHRTRLAARLVEPPAGAAPDPPPAERKRKREAPAPASASASALFAAD